jgi:hypothetical protein
MGRGLSRRQRRALGILVLAHRPLNATRELGPLFGSPASDSGRRSLLRALRLLERRGLVRLERRPASGGGRTVFAAANAGAKGELTGAELWRAGRM